MELQPMYKALTNSPETAITGDISAESKYITVMSASAIPPDLPNLMTLGKTDTAETVRVLELDGNTLTVERGADGMARAWKTGTVIARGYTAAEHNNIINNISELGVRFSPLENFDPANYYDKNQTDAKLELYASDVYTREQSDALLQTKADLVDGKVPPEQLPELGAVQSVFGRTGAVAAQAGDYTAEQVSLATIAGLEAGTVQEALEEITVSNAEEIGTWNGKLAGSSSGYVNFVGEYARYGSLFVISGRANLANAVGTIAGQIIIENTPVVTKITTNGAINFIYLPSGSKVLSTSPVVRWEAKKSMMYPVLNGIVGGTSGVYAADIGKDTIITFTILAAT